ncbi:MAG: sialate O-acetylesterase [Sphingomonas sp.]|jgi:sialate O-acetylesterase|uniref:sialate O-acetylesterase n=1 Tax=Sphingomonas sp. TaxID=28214 RepID=UPI00356AB991
MKGPFRALILAGLGLAAPAIAADAPILHVMFQDHAVLQRDKPIPVYGQAAPNTTVTVKLGTETATAKADKTGQWRTTLAALPSGGPYTLEARSGTTTQSVQDVLIGDVFLCTGQSNMQLAVRAAGNATFEMRAATDGQIRQLGIATKDSLTPLSTFATPVSWTVGSPDTVGNFSASCYYFAREIKKTTNAPVGLVVSAWGGSRVRDWVSEPNLRKLGQYNADLDMLALYRTNPQAAQRRWDSSWESWWKASGAAAAKGNPWEPAYPVTDWKTAPAALGPWALWTGTSPDGFVGQMWLRTTVDLTAAQAAQAATLDLGSVNEEDQSWINGKGVGGTSWSKQALHDIPAGVLHAGANIIVTNIFCSWRNCGMSGPAETRAIRLKDGGAVPLSNPWRYAEVPNGLIAPQLPWGPTHGVTQLYYGMIAPIGGYGFRAAIWYQGESDIYFNSQYQATLTAMMGDWRDRFGADLPFLIVQIPNYGPRPTAPMESVWSDVREAQRRAAMADAKAAYIVTVDIGDATNLHPSNKQDIGRRLAIAARHAVYGDPTPAAGAVPGVARRTADGVVVPFGQITGTLAAWSGQPNAFELCGPAAGSCRYADARIDGTTVVVKADATDATRIRYCWGDSPTCTLTDTSGLPVTPFELTIPPR